MEKGESFWFLNTLFSKLGQVSILGAWPLLKGMALNMDIKTDKIFTGMGNGPEVIQNNFSKIVDALNQVGGTLRLSHGQI